MYSTLYSCPILMTLD